MSTASAFGKFGCTAASAASIVSLSIISTAAGMMPAAMISDTAAPAASVESNAARIVLHRLRHAQDAQRHLRDDRERAFRSDERAEQIEAGRVERRPAEVHHLAVRQHRLDAEHVMNREPVLQAVRAAGVLGHVAADRADQLARRIGRVVVAVRRDASRDIEVDHARLDGDALVRDVDVDDAVEPRQPDQHAVRAAAARRRTSPVPWPRATNGIFCAWHSRTICCTSSAVVGQHDAARRGAAAARGRPIRR